jgi:UDP-N-acetylglucosamine--N-acetylmuramyl-(pentapeptide) pyrophosphoryl-undecaprenol N-acetylglucosamine transferase
VATRLLIAGGGTGGHLFPGVAIAEALRAREPNAEVLFVGTARGIEARVLEPAGWQLALIEASGLKTVGVLGALKGLFKIPRAVWQSRAIIKAFRPDVVLGVGGYASGPTMLMAWLMRRPTAVLEPNSIPGLANKLAGRFARAVFLSFDETRRFFAPRKVRMTGNPIRAGIRGKLLAQPGAGAGATRAAAGPFRLFVFGGSQGAMAINELVVDAIAQLRGAPIAIVHQTGERDLDRTRARYAAAGIEADCRAFITDMAAEYGRAELVIGRAGAGTLAELAVVGCPALLIPLPSSADNHQEINAREVAAHGAAKMLRQPDLDASKLAEELRILMEEPASLERMRSDMKALGRPDAADLIVDWLKSAGEHV